jgi:hypothetical protein
LFEETPSAPAPGPVPSFLSGTARARRNQHGLEADSGPSLSSPALGGMSPAQVPPAKPAHVFWAPLSVVFLALGIVLGFAAALLLQKPERESTADPYALNLTVVRNGQNLELTWDPQLAAIRRALRGTLTITDGERVTPRQLSPQELEVGKAVYRRFSNKVIFQLQVFTAENAGLSERLELNMGGADPTAPAAPSADTQDRRRRRR